MVPGAEGFGELAGDRWPDAVGVATVPLTNDVFDRELPPEVEVKVAILPASAELTDAAGPHMGGTSVPEQ